MNPQQRAGPERPGIRDLLLITSGVAVFLAAERYLAWLDHETLRRIYAVDVRGVLTTGLTLRSLAAAVSGGGAALAFRVLLSARKHPPSAGRWCVMLLGSYAAVAYAAAILAGWLAWRFDARYAAGIPLVAWGQLAGALGGAGLATWALQRKAPPRLWYWVWLPAAVYFAVTTGVWVLVHLSPSAFHWISYSTVRVAHHVTLLTAGSAAAAVLAWEWWTAGKDWIVGSASIGLVTTLVVALTR